MTGIDHKRIRKLCDGRWEGITRAVFGRICAATGATAADLFEVLPADVWFPIRRDRTVTVHLGSTSLEARSAARGGAYIDKLGVGTRDVRSLFRVYQYLNETTPGGVVFEYAEHTEEAHGPAAVDGIFAQGNHLIFGSPTVNPIAEDVVCRAWRVPPRRPSRSPVFPYRFRWDRAKSSAFGGADGPGEPGILSGDGLRQVARRTVIAAGDDGEDCGLVFTYRHDPRARPGAEPSDDDDVVVIAIMGHSGCGTLAGTQLLCSDDAARALYPAARDTGTLRAFRVTYRRADATRGFDNREILSYALVPDA